MNLNTVTLSSASSGLVNLGSYYKKPIVIFNSASLCSYTSQLKDFQTLYETGKIIPMAMPTNEFRKPDRDSPTLQYKVWSEICGVRQNNTGS